MTPDAALSSPGIDVWWHLGPPTDEQRLALSAEEREHGASITNPAVASQFVASRGLLRLALSCAEGGVAPDEWRFVRSDTGKPAIDGPLASLGLQFSVSHTGDVALVAVRRGGCVGVDVERLDRQPRVDALIERYFAEQERAELAAIEGDARRVAFLALWVHKEAVIKALGSTIGASVSAAVFEDLAGTPRLVRDPDGRGPDAWNLRSVRSSSTIAAVAALAR